MARHSDPLATKVIDLLNKHNNGSYNDNRVRDLYTYRAQHSILTHLSHFLWDTPCKYVRIIFILGSELHHREKKTSGCYQQVL